MKVGTLLSKASRISRLVRLKGYIFFLKFRHNGLRHKYEKLNNALINIGCGSRGQPGWINVDLFACEGVNCVCDCRKRLPFPDNSAQAIFTEHFFEHIHYEDDVPSFLQECHRVLSPGGVLRIIVPDAGQYLRVYCEPGWEAISKLRPLDETHRDSYFRITWNTKMELVNFIFRQEGEHHFAYDAETLEFVLRKTGFSQVTRQQFGRSEMPGITLDWDRRATESLYMEATK